MHRIYDFIFCFASCVALAEIRQKNISALVGEYIYEYAVACQHLNILYIITSQAPLQFSRNTFQVELFPNYGTFSQAVIDFISYYGFKKFAIIYDNVTGKPTKVFIIHSHRHTHSRKLK